VGGRERCLLIKTLDQRNEEEQTLRSEDRKEMELLSGAEEEKEFPPPNE
jgi:hypothetical protein